MRSELVKLNENTVIDVKEDTQYVLDLSSAADGGKYSIELKFNKQGINGELLGLYNLTDSQKIDITTIARHIAPNTSCMTKIKGVLNDGSSSEYVGKILIEKTAQQTNSFLHDGVLVTGDKTHNNAQPILEIEADDVKASHGATTGRIDKEQVYYLMSHGLNRDEAEKLVIEGYFEDLLSRIVDPEVREKVEINIKSNQ
jgi:Fe-S cluster assembly protein SufD